MTCALFVSKKIGEVFTFSWTVEVEETNSVNVEIFETIALTVVDVDIVADVISEIFYKSKFVVKCESLERIKRKLISK